MKRNYSLSDTSGFEDSLLPKSVAMKVYRNMVGKKISQKNLKYNRPTLDFTNNYRTISGAIDLEVDH